MTTTFLIVASLSIRDAPHFFDTEFTRLTRDARLISIGLVDESRIRTFYVELPDTWRLNDSGEFAAHELIPLLEGNDLASNGT